MGGAGRDEESRRDGMRGAAKFMTADANLLREVAKKWSAMAGDHRRSVVV